MDTKVLSWRSLRYRVLLAVYIFGMTHSWRKRRCWVDIIWEVRWLKCNEWLLYHAFYLWKTNLIKDKLHRWLIWTVWWTLKNAVKYFSACFWYIRTSPPTKYNVHTFLSYFLLVLVVEAAKIKIIIRNLNIATNECVLQVHITMHSVMFST